MVSAMWQNRRISIVSGVISLLISVVDIKCDHSLFLVRSKGAHWYQNQNKITDFLFRHKTATATYRTGWQGSISAGAVMLYEITKHLS